MLINCVWDNMYRLLYRFTKGTEREKAEKKERRMKLIEQFKSAEAMEVRKKRRLATTSYENTAADDIPAASVTTAAYGVAAASLSTAVTTTAITSSQEVEDAAR
jgi:hypothetical protein